jgi:hypothetical protein
MTTYTTDDIESLKTEWFPFDLDPVNEGEYEVMSTAWPWTHRVEWTKANSWGAVKINQWRGLKVRITE